VDPGTVITNGITFPIGIAFDRKGDMFVSNRSGGSGTNVGSTMPSSNSISQDLDNPEGSAYSPPVLPKK